MANTCGFPNPKLQQRDETASKAQKYQAQEISKLIDSTSQLHVPIGPAIICSTMCNWLVLYCMLNSVILVHAMQMLTSYDQLFWCIKSFF